MLRRILLSVCSFAIMTYGTVENENGLSANQSLLNSEITVSNTVVDSQFQKMEADSICKDTIQKTTEITKEVVSSPEVKYTWHGKCTRYSDKYHGRKTASGCVFNQQKLTAAKSTFNKMDLPYGSKVRVTNLDNNKSVIITINDNGPFKGKSTKNNLDLSKAAYFSINIKGKDLNNVKFEVIVK